MIFSYLIIYDTYKTKYHLFYFIYNIKKDFNGKWMLKRYANLFYKMENNYGNTLSKIIQKCNSTIYKKLQALNNNKKK